jgi:hypothetical protein
MLSKRRASRRATSGGAIMFILAMTLAVLASLGVYAMRSASTEVRTSGYQRQSAQSQYLSEYGVLAATQQMGGSVGQLNVNLMTSTPDAKCASLQGIDLGNASARSKSCRRIGAVEVQGALNPAVTPVEPYAVGAKAGSLGPYPISGDYFVELTDPAYAGAAAETDTRIGLCFVESTITSFGLTRPDTTILAALAANPTAFHAQQGQQVSRARIIAGPIRCQP